MREPKVGPRPSTLPTSGSSNRPSLITWLLIFTSVRPRKSSSVKSINYYVEMQVSTLNNTDTYDAWSSVWLVSIRLTSVSTLWCCKRTSNGAWRKQSYTYLKFYCGHLSTRSWSGGCENLLHWKKQNYWPTIQKNTKYSQNTCNYQHMTNYFKLI